jgi:ankyrin repeat protein
MVQVQWHAPTVATIPFILPALRSIMTSAFCWPGRCHLVQSCISPVNHVTVDVCDNELRTPLFYCAQQGSLQNVIMLLHDYKADISVVDVYRGRRVLVALFYATDTILHVACYAGHFEVVRCLVERFGARLDVENVFSETPLSAACTFGREMFL